MVYLIQNLIWSFHSSHIEKQSSMSLKCNMQNFLCTDQICGSSRALCQYGTGLKFKDLLFGIFSTLNEVSQRCRLLKSFPTYPAAQKIPRTMHACSHGRFSKQTLPKQPRLGLLASKRKITGKIKSTLAKIS